MALDKAKLIQRLMGTFLEELQEHIRTLNQELICLEKNPEESGKDQHIPVLFRAAHSLKGAARSVSVKEIESACHRLEEILSAAQKNLVRWHPPLFRLLFATVDALEEAGRRLSTGQTLEDSPLATLLAPLESALSEKQEPAAFEAAVPRPAEPATVPAPPPVPPVELVQATALVPLPASPVVLASSPPATALAQQGNGLAATSPKAPSPEPSAAPAASKEMAGPVVPVSAPVTTSVRISAEKLDTLLARLGELLVARRRMRSAPQDVFALREFVEHWKNSWRGVERWLDHLTRGEEEKSNGMPAGGHGAPATVRLQVPLRVSRILSQTGTNLRKLEKELDRLGTSLSADNRYLGQVASPLEEEVRRARMFPFAEACAGLDRMARDLAQSKGKDINLVTEGGAVELDRAILEGLKDPLRHLVRNAIDHGCETPAERRAAGKPPQARIVVAAGLRGAQVEVTVQDDGRGLNLDALRDQARKRKIPEPSTERELAQLVFLPGLSTAPFITDVSGRGVGMDVVKNSVEALHGTIDLSFRVGQGTRFTMMVPLTLTTFRAVLVLAAGHTYAFAGTNVQKLVRIKADEVRMVGGQATLTLGGPPLPLLSLEAVLHPGAAPTPRQDGQIPIVIVAAGENRMAFSVGDFLAEQEIVVKGLGHRVHRTRYVAAATILPSGKLALVLNASSLVRTALHQAAMAAPALAAEAATVEKKRLLVAEDSLTTRALMKSILESAGYDVTTAVDGLAAWEYLQDHPVDLLVTDVDMPRMNGFTLAESVRTSKRWPELPVILVTARDTEQDKARGIEVGADAYLRKGVFDQRNLLETIAQLL